MTLGTAGRPVRAAVIGVGGIGRHHARVYTQLEGVELVAIADPDPVMRQTIARRYKVAAYPDHESLLASEALDAVSIAVPTAVHMSIALAAISCGVHVLVEKPLAATVEQARRVVGCAADSGVTLAVGHIERFNPAVVALRPRLLAGEIGRIFQLQARRLSPFPVHIRDVGVVMDLATHELDIMCHLAGSPIERIYAEVERNIHDEHEDMLVATLRFASGAVGLLDISWLTPTKVRELRVTGERGMFVVDYLAQDLFLYENRIAPSQWETMALFRGVEEGNILKLRVAKVEPLEAELRAFVDAVVNRESPVVTGLDGLRAVGLAALLLEAAHEGQVLHVAPEARRRGWMELLEG